MTKIPWSPPERPPRIEVREPIADFTPVSMYDRCETCVGMGVLYRTYSDGSKTAIECHACKGTGLRDAPPTCFNCGELDNAECLIHGHCCDLCHDGKHKG